MKRLFWVFALGIGVTQTAHAAPPMDPCVAATETVTGHIVRVETNGILVLDDGRAADLEGIRLPQGEADHAPRFLAQQALDALNAMMKDRVVVLAMRPLKEDRYGRMRAQAFQGSDWVQIALLRQGLARVAPSPARGECTDKFYAAEEAARSARLGLWSSGAYAVRTPDTVSDADLGTFQIVEGKVQNADVKGGRAYLNFGYDWRTDFTVTIAPEDMPAFRAAGVDPRDYAGKTVRVRGFVDRMNGPEIEVGSAQAIEVLK